MRFHNAQADVLQLRLAVVAHAVEASAVVASADSEMAVSAAMVANSLAVACEGSALNSASHDLA